MNEELLDQIENLSVEIHSLVRQGVKTLIDERLEQRGELLQQLFESYASQGQVPSPEQQARLEKILAEDQAALGQLSGEQTQYQNRNRKKNKLKMYKQNL
jgi:hypothetical protein